jgi:hypothetical protein
MVDWSKKFKPEYDATKASISKINDFDSGWRVLVGELKVLMSADGFDGAKSNALDDLRDKVKGRSNARVTEDEGILRAVGAWSDTDTGAIAAEAKKRAAGLKLLRHVYLQNKYGGRCVWVVNIPDDFTDWPSRFLATNASTTGRVKQLLVSKNEHFTDQQRRFLGNSTQQALAWCQKAGMVLANAAAGGAGTARDEARAMVKRWFAESGLADMTLDSYIADLTQGFRKIIAMLNKGNFTVTDWVPFRGTSDADELDFLRSEAFTFASNAEGMDVVYIESAFFVGNNVLNGQANWTRIIVHELTHLVCGTEDVRNGQTRYAWYGIGPHAGYPGSDCIRNAENWAFFAADCGSALSDSERNTALKII